MAEFYGREGSFQDFYLELPTQKVIDRDLSEAKLQVEAMKENALAQKEYDRDYLNALSAKYKIQNKNLAANFKLKQDNYDDIFRAHQLNSKREFESIQKAQGNVGPKEVSALGELVKFAPKLIGMIGEYKQKEWDWKVNTTTDFVTSTGIKAADLARWENDRKLIESNSIEAQQYIKAESEKFGVQLTPGKMLQVMNATGDLAIIRQEALNNNALMGYGAYLAGNGDTQIVLSDGTETTWAEMQNPNNSGERYLEALRFMKGKFLKENEIDILTQPIGPLGSLTEKMFKVEDQFIGRWNRSKSQQTAIDYTNAVTTKYINSIEESGSSVLVQINNRALVLGSKDKPDYTGAWKELFGVLRKGIQTGTTQSSEVQAIINTHGEEKKGPIMQELRGILDDARAKESGDILQIQRNFNAKSLQLYNELEDMMLGDPAEGGWGGESKMDPARLDAWLKGLPLTSEHRKRAKALLLPGTEVFNEKRVPSNTSNTEAKAFHTGGLDSALQNIGNLAGGAEKDLIKHEQISGWDLFSADIGNMYNTYYNEKANETIGTEVEKARAAAIYASAQVLDFYKRNEGLLSISPATVTNPNGEQVQQTNEQRRYTRYEFKENQAVDNSSSSKLAKLKDTQGVSPTDRVLSMSKPEDAILDKSDVDRYLDSDGNISLRSFKADPLVREIVKQTGIPASDLYQRHAELYGLPTLSDTDHFTYEELQQSTKPIQRMIHYNSPSSEIVGRTALDPATHARPAPYLNTSFNVAGLNGTTPNYDNRSFTYVPEHRALLDLISFAEGTYDQPHSGYGTKVGFSKFDFMRGHDRVIPPGQISDASGRYQFLSTTWGTTGHANRPMTPEAQDWAATRLVLRRLNLPQDASGVKVLMNRLNTEGITEEFIDALAPEWASMPNLFGPDRDGREGTRSSYYGQGGKSYEELTEFYNKVLSTYNTRRGVEV